MLFGGPLVAAILAGWRYSGTGSPLTLPDAKVRQAAAAGSLVTFVGSLFVSVLGPVTLALLPRAWFVSHLLYPGQHLTAEVIANRAHYLASNGAPFYFFIWFLFPIIGLAIGSWSGLAIWHRGTAEQSGGEPGGGGSDGPEPVPPFPLAAGLPTSMMSRSAWPSECTPRRESLSRVARELPATLATDGHVS